MKKHKEMEGFSFVMGLIDTVSPFGTQKKRNLKVYSTQEELSKELKKTKEFSVKVVELEETCEKLRSYLRELKDIRALVDAASKNQVLTVVDLFELKYFLQRMHKVEALWKEFEEEDLLPERLPHLTRILDPKGENLSTFYIYEEYDDALRWVRDEKRAMEKRIRQAKSEDEKNALFLERRVLLQKEEEAEYQVRKELSRTVSKEADKLYHSMEVLGQMDFLLAKARVAKQYGCSLPKLDSSIPMTMQGAWHPYFQHLLEKRGKKMTKISIELKPGSTALTGANMGGKSMALKTIHLNAVLVKYGLLPFAEEMSCPFFKEVHLLHDDQEEVRQGLSSFGGEVLKIREILSSLSEMPSLIILDEPARGTNPVEGTAIVGGLLNHFKNKHHFLLIATHFDLHELMGIYRYQVKGLKEHSFGEDIQKSVDNSHVLVDRLQEKMDYSLEKWDGSKATGDAVRIAEYLGFTEELTKEIRKLLE